MVPLTGHTHGHAGVAVERSGACLLNAADAYFYREEMDPDNPRCTPGLRFYQWMMEKNRSARLHNQQRLRELRLAHSAEVRIFCAHDVEEFERLSGRPARLPAEAISGRPEQTEQQLSWVSSAVKAVVPGPAALDHCIEDGQQLTHRRDQGEFLRLAGGDQALIEEPDCRIMVAATRVACIARGAAQPDRRRWCGGRAGCRSHG